jgi:hypothetical protein
LKQNIESSLALLISRTTFTLLFRSCKSIRIHLPQNGIETSEFQGIVRPVKVEAVSRIARQLDGSDLE